MESEEKSVMTLAEVAEYLRISESTVYKLAREGVIPAQKLGKQWRFHKLAVTDWLKGHNTSDSKKP